ncbi:MAG: hypothetical protein ACT4P9_10710 [Betaproteobacteria bacterium]
MFTWLNKQGVRSSEGFEVQSVDRYTIEYREGGKTISVPVEMGARTVTDEEAFGRWDPPFNTVSISDEKRQQIFRNFNAAMKVLYSV